LKRRWKEEEAREEKKERKDEAGIARASVDVRASNATVRERTAMRQVC